MHGCCVFEGRGKLVPLFSMDNSWVCFYFMGMYAEDGVWVSKVMSRCV